MPAYTKAQQLHQAEDPADYLRDAAPSGNPFACMPCAYIPGATAAQCEEWIVEAHRLVAQALGVAGIGRVTAGGEVRWTAAVPEGEF